MTTYLLLWVAGGIVGAGAAIVVMASRQAFTGRAFVGGLLAAAGFVAGAKAGYRLEFLGVGEALRTSVSELLTSGERLPLGLLVGGVLAWLWCVAVRVPVRHAGDALAVGAIVMIAIGRLGCWTNGCCTGGPCPAWAAPWCVAFPRDTDAYNAQIRDGLIQADAPASLPAHPLPLYFAIGALAILAVQLWLLYRRATPGMLLLVTLCLGSASKLLLETLRANARPPGIFFVVPIVALAASAGALGLAGCRGRGSGRHVPAAMIILLAFAAASGPVRAAASTPEVDAVVAYARDPLGSRRMLRRLEHDGPADASPLVLLAMADARLRSGQRRQATRLFSAVLARDPGEPWAGWARLGIGWSALVTGDVDGARPYLAEIGAAGTPASGLAKLLLALIDVHPGSPAASERCAAVAEDPAVDPMVRDVARLGEAYGRYWAGDYAAAAEVFDAFAERTSLPALVDDARYGAAWSRVRAGAPTAGTEALRALAAGAARRGPAVSAALLNLDQQALLRAAFARYRRGPLRPPEDLLASLLDGDGRALARQALDALDDGTADAPSVRISTARSATTEPASRPVVARTSAPVPDGATRDGSRGGRWGVGVLAAATVALIVVSRRRA
jgi:phosphatidylglycerol:prolipoprotein diacylglycerol transferase